MSFNLDELNTTKVLDVQSMKFGSEHDAGYDMYVPKFTTEFLKALLTHPSNKKINTFLCVLDNGDTVDNFAKLAEFELVFEIESLFLYETVNVENPSNGDRIHTRSTPVLSYQNKTINVFDLVSIPTGLQLLLPKNVWGEMCNRSSNFAKNLNVVIGYIDNPYTYLTAFQIHPINFGKPAVFEAETRIAQLILRPHIKPLYIHHSYQSFEEDSTVKYRREKRDGGFGSTGSK